MELAVALDPLAVALHPLFPGQVFDDTQSMVSGDNMTFPIIVAMGDRISDGTLFQVHKVIGHLDQLFPRHPRNLEALARFQRDESFRDQLGERFAQGADSHIITFGKISKFQLGFRFPPS